MPQALYAFTFNTETKEYTRTGNISTATAIKILQNILITELTKTAPEGGKVTPATE